MLKKWVAGDGGIDGIIKEDSLGLEDNQGKRWDDVPEKEIRDFTD